MKLSKLLRNSQVYSGLLVAAVLVFTFVFVLPSALEPRNSNSKASETNEHDETNSDGHHGTNQDIGELVDLTAQSTVAMDIKDMKYAQPNIKIKKGTTVTWTNQDTIEPNVMQEHADSGTAHDGPLPNEVKPTIFAGPLLAKGESYSFTFNEVGADPYHCSPHPYMK